MDTHRFSQGTRFFWKGQEYQVKKLLSKNTVAIENQATGKVQVIALATLQHAFYDGELRMQLDRVEIDYTPIDVVVVPQIGHSGTKLQPTYLIDRATRYVVGFSFESRED